MEKWNYWVLNAYALGYYDGRAVGVENNQFESDEQHLAYKQGYDRGVADYCDLDADKED